MMLKACEIILVVQSFHFKSVANFNCKIEVGIL